MSMAFQSDYLKVPFRNELGQHVLALLRNILPHLLYGHNH